jgi:4-hydroxyacetophenone monooxygenase
MTALDDMLKCADLDILAALTQHLTRGEVTLDEAAPEERIRAAAKAALADAEASAVRYVPVSDRVLHAAMERCVRERIGQEYVSMARQVMGFDPPSRFTRHGDLPTEFSAIVIGAGISGICVSIMLDQLGIPHKVLEERSEFGGTWAVNHYPGCGVDTASYVYAYSFAPPLDWGTYYPQRKDVLEYVRAIAAEHKVAERIELGHSVKKLRWDEVNNRWELTVVAQGIPQLWYANVVISAVGILCQPKIPQFDGADTFEGRIFHSSQWPSDFYPAGQRVAVVGGGASANQIVPAIAPDVEHLYVFQRSPHWMAPSPLTFSEIPSPLRELFARVPAYASWFRFKTFWEKADQIFGTLEVDANWPHQDRSVSEGNDQTRQRLTAHIRAELADREDLFDILVPDYPPYGKRMLLDHGWYRALTRSNVTVVTDPIERLEPRAVIAGGIRYEVGTIVAATGFLPDRVLAPMEVIGAGGVDIRARWGDNPVGFLGVATADCPNLWMIFGPNSNLAHGGSAFFITECQTHYIGCCLKAMIERGWRQMALTAESQDRYNTEVDAMLARYVWTSARMHSWYKNSAGKVTTNLPWRLVDYWHRTRDVDLANFRGSRGM